MQKHSSCRHQGIKLELIPSTIETQSYREEIESDLPPSNTIETQSYQEEIKSELPPSTIESQSYPEEIKSELPPSNTIGTQSYQCVVVASNSEDAIEYLDVDGDSDDCFQDALLKHYVEEKDCPTSDKLLLAEHAYGSSKRTVGRSTKTIADKTTNGTIKEKSNNHGSTNDTYFIKKMDEKGVICYECNICMQTFVNKKCTESHMNTVHNGLSCEVCGKSFKIKYDLNRHLNVHRGLRPFPCPECDKSFVCRSSLMRHRKLQHLVGDIYKCHLCGKTFRAETDLKRHLLTHTGERPWSCDQCTKSFVSKSSLMVHKRSHDESQKYTCFVCNKKFHIRTDLVRHEATHSGNLKWECAICRKTYSGKSALKRHIKDAHIFEKIAGKKVSTDSWNDYLEKIKREHTCSDRDAVIKSIDCYVIYRGDKASEPS